mgnify:CR=1 FL=1
MKFHKFTTGLIFSVITGMSCVLIAAEDKALHEWGEHSKEDLYEGAITIEADDGTRKVATVLGGPRGTEVVDGSEVGRVVVQASHPERLTPGAGGPTRICNVTCGEEGGS